MPARKDRLEAAVQRPLETNRIIVKVATDTARNSLAGWNEVIEAQSKTASRGVNMAKKKKSKKNRLPTQENPFVIEYQLHSETKAGSQKYTTVKEEGKPLLIDTYSAYLNRKAFPEAPAGYVLKGAFYFEKED